MIAKVLIVDADRELVTGLKNDFAPYADMFTVVAAADAQGAGDTLRHELISLVVTDLDMPLREGVGLLKHLMEHYPEIPIFITPGASTPDMERLARQAGAAAYIPKPYRPDHMAQEIVALLHSESDGGTLHGVSSGIFLQLIEMEQKTCTIRLEEKNAGQKGILFFFDGELLDARVAHLRGKPAAQRILTWDKVTISIQNKCPRIENTVDSELQPLVLEAARLKDEVSPSEDPLQEPAESAGAAAAGESAPADAISQIRCVLESRIGRAGGIEDIYQDNSWNSLIHRLAALGDHFQNGPMKLCFVDRGDSSDHIIIPGHETTVISVSPKSPHDKIIQALNP
ncbi:MAG: response regulator [Desulfobacterales bacterium]